MDRYYFILRASSMVINGIWRDVTAYPYYTVYKSVYYSDLQEMVEDYRDIVQKYHLEHHPLFFYNGVYLNNSDGIYFGFDEVGTPETYDDDVFTLSDYDYDDVMWLERQWCPTIVQMYY